MFRGHGLRDLAYFLNSAIPNEMRQSHGRGLFDRYVAGLGAGGVTVDPEQAWRDYGLFILEQWDAHMKGYVFGGYGHMPESRLRSSQTLAGALIDHDVAGLISQIVRKGSLD